LATYSSSRTKRTEFGVGLTKTLRGTRLQYVNPKKQLISKNM
jgi:hypothetical protein